EDAAVSAIDRAASGCGRQRELDMNLHIAEFLFRGEIAAAWHNLHVSVLDSPCRRARTNRHSRRHGLRGRKPVREVFAIEENDRIRGWLAGVFSGRHLLRIGPRRVMYVPLLTRN